MPQIVRVGDSVATGHPCTGSTSLAGHNTDGSVFANGIVIAVIGAPTQVHEQPPCNIANPHSVNLAAGSPKTYVNGIQVGRIGDSIDAGAMSGGSPDVFADNGGSSALTTVTQTIVADPTTGDDVTTIYVNGVVAIIDGVPQ